MSTYLVTGGAGFIASHLVDKLIEEGNEVIVLDDCSDGNKHNLNSKSKFVQGSILDAKLLEDIFSKVDFCYHLAATASVQKSISNWRKVHTNNLTGSIAIFNEASKKKVPVIYASSAAVYGAPTKTPISEDDSKNPTSPYGLDKLCVEHQAALFGGIHGLKSLGLRFFNVYGTRQDPSSPYSGVISIFVDKIKQNKPIKIYGDGKQERDFIYVDDVVKTLLKSRDFVSTTSDIYNVCTGEAITISDLAQIISKILGKEVEIEYLTAREGDIYKSIGNPSKIKKLGCEKFIDIESGLSKLLN